MLILNMADCTGSLPVWRSVHPTVLGPVVVDRLRPDEVSGEYGAVKTAEEIEDEELVHWASLKEHQERFVQSEEILIGA